MIELLAGQLQDLSIEELLGKFEAEAKLDGTYFFCNQESLTQIAKLIKGVGCMGLHRPQSRKLCVVGTPDDVSPPNPIA